MSMYNKHNNQVRKADVCELKSNICNLQEEKEEILAKAAEEPEETPDEKRDRFQDVLEAERLERKSKLNAYKVKEKLDYLLMFRYCVPKLIAW